MDYCILSLPFSRGLNQIDVASVLARAVRAADLTCTSENMIQYPLLDGGEGTLELLVTCRLGSFLEVEAKNFLGEEIVVPLGFVGDDQSIAIIRMGALRNEAEGFESAGTTYGVGELIRDALDEGAFSILLCHDEPLARDAGLGIAAALGVTFFDSKDVELDLSKPIPDLFDRIARIDARNRPFELLSARVYIARSGTSVLAKPDKQLVAQLKKLSAIAEEGGAAGKPSVAAYSNSLIEFGAGIFLPSEIKEGSMIVLEASMIQTRIEASSSLTYLIAARDALQLQEEGVPSALRTLLDIAAAKHARVIVVTEGLSTPADIKEVQHSFPSISSFVSLGEAPLFAALLTSSASDETVRRDQQMRIEKLVPVLLKKTGKAAASIVA